jgi:predicted acylesterase/phospholipase RssA
MREIGCGVRLVLAAMILLLFFAVFLIHVRLHLELMIRYPFYLLLYLFLVSIAFGVFGRAFGLSNLLWQEKRLPQFKAGLGLALLLALMSIVSYEILHDLDGDQRFLSMREFRDDTLRSLTLGLSSPAELRVSWPVDVTEADVNLDDRLRLAQGLVRHVVSSWAHPNPIHHLKVEVEGRAWPVEEGELNRIQKLLLPHYVSLQRIGPKAIPDIGKIDKELAPELVDAYRDLDPGHFRKISLAAMSKRMLLFVGVTVLPCMGILCLPALLPRTLARCYALPRLVRTMPEPVGGSRGVTESWRDRWRWLQKELRDPRLHLELGVHQGFWFCLGSFAGFCLALILTLAFCWFTVEVFERVVAGWLPELAANRPAWLPAFVPTRPAFRRWWDTWSEINPALFAEISVFQGLCIAVLIAVIVAFRSDPLRKQIPASTSLFVILSLVAMVYGFIVHWAFLHPLAQFVVAGVLIAIVLSCNAGSYRLRFPHMTFVGERGTRDSYRDLYRADVQKSYARKTTSGYVIEPSSDLGSKHEQPEATRPRAPIVLDETEKLLPAWSEFVRRAGRHDRRPPLVIVSTSGGSIRAAFWTVRVLSNLELQSEFPGFPYHIRLVTGASGGMLGASLYVSDLSENDAAESHKGRDPDRITAALRLQRDCLTPVARSLALFDLPGMISSRPLEYDRGRALEDAWVLVDQEGHERKPLDIPFRQLAQGERAGWRPSLVLSPMLVEDGRRLLVSNLDLSHLTLNRGSLLVEPRSRRLSDQVADGPSSRDEDLYSLSAYEFFRLFPGAEDFRLATAVRMSATFPFISPAVSLPMRPPRRVVDAGYYDNFGVNLASMWLAEHREAIVAETSGVVLIQIRAFASQREILHDQKPPDISPLFATSDNEDRSLSNGFRFLSSPLQAVLQARRSVMSYRNDEQLEVLSAWFRDRTRQPDFFQTVSFECPASASLSWHITKEEYANILSSFVPSTGWDPIPPRVASSHSSAETNINAERLLLLKKWWARSAERDAAVDAVRASRPRPAPSSESAAEPRSASTILT